MASLLEALQAREQAARTRVEGLRAEMDRLAEQVAAEQELLGRLEITRQTVVEVLAGDDLPGGDADQAQAAGGAWLAGRDRAGAVRLRPGRGRGAGRQPLTRPWAGWR
jgi:hypothetical protein